MKRRKTRTNPPAPAVGIDLGTTFSCVSVYKNRKADIIPNDRGDRLTPSVVYFDKETKEVSVGKIAEELMLQYPGNGILDAKRVIGRKYDDEFITRLGKSNQNVLSLVRAPDDQLAFEVEIEGEKVMKLPEHVSAEVLKYLKNIASSHLGNDVSEAVIAVPAYFSIAQREATKRAAELAGLKVLKLVTEPTAAAIHYVSDKKKKKAHILVFDLGGGTLDVSLIKVENQKFEVKSVYGDTLLGGRNFDEILFKYFQKDFLQTHGTNVENKRFFRRLDKKCTNLKETLSVTDGFALDMDSFDAKDSDYNLSMTRKKFEELSEDIFRRCLEAVKLCLNDVGWSKSIVDEVVLVGGSTRIPKIRQMLEEFFDDTNATLKMDLNPDEAVAAGAAMQAALLKGRSKRDLERYSITEVTPLSLGIKTEGDYMSVIIPRNSSLPTIKENNVYNSCNNQSNMLFEIYEGERKNTVYNNKLGEFSICGLPLNRAGSVSIKVSFELDEDGLLTVAASEESTGKSNRLRVTMGQFRLSEKTIERTIEEAQRNSSEDETFEKFILTRRTYDRQCNDILYDIKKIPSVVDQQFVQKSCTDFLEISKHLNFMSIDLLEKKFQSLMASLNTILEKE